MKMIVKNIDLKPGDYVPAAKGTVTGVHLLGYVAIVDLDDNTATAPIPVGAPVTIERTMFN